MYVKSYAFGMGTQPLPNNNVTAIFNYHHGSPVLPVDFGVTNYGWTASKYGYLHFHGLVLKKKLKLATMT